MEKAFFPIPFGRKMSIMSLKSGTDLTSGIDRRMYGMERGRVVEKAFFPILFGRKTSCMPLLCSCTRVSSSGYTELSAAAAHIHLQPMHRRIINYLVRTSS